MIGDLDHAHEYLNHKIGKVYTRPLSFDYLGWCKEPHVCLSPKKATGFSSNFMTFFHLICVTLDLVISWCVLEHKYLSLPNT